MTVRTAHLTQAAARATQLARAAGGYVSSENTALNRAHPDRSTVSLQLKIPVSAYQATLGALSTQLGARLAMSQHAQDVTQTVADVTSRVTSAEAAISQLRSLLRHAGSVGSLLTVQNQINAEESGLESLLARQRALNHETSFGTVTLLLVAPAAATQHKKHHAAGGFVGGLKAGWHGLVRVGRRSPDRSRRRPPLRGDPGRCWASWPTAAATGSYAAVPYSAARAQAEQAPPIPPPSPERRPQGLWRSAGPVLSRRPALSGGALVPFSRRLLRWEKEYRRGVAHEQHSDAQRAIANG